MRCMVNYFYRIPARVRHTVPRCCVFSPYGLVNSEFRRTIGVTTRPFGAKCSTRARWNNTIDGEEMDGDRHSPTIRSVHYVSARNSESRYFLCPIAADLYAESLRIRLTPQLVFIVPGGIGGIHYGTIKCEIKKNTAQCETVKWKNKHDPETFNYARYGWMKRPPYK